MHKLRAHIATTLGVLALVSVPALAQWNHRVDSELSSEQGKHPAGLTHTLIVPADSEGPMWLCIGYGNDFNKSDDGRIKSTFELARTDPETGDAVVERLVRRGSVRGNNFVGCKEIEGLAAGDTIIAQHVFTGFPRFREGAVNVVTFVGPEKLPSEDLLAPPEKPAPLPPPAEAPAPEPDPEPDPAPDPAPDPPVGKDYSYVSIPLNMFENVGAANWDKKLVETGYLTAKQRRAWNRKQGTVFRLQLTKRFAPNVQWKLAEIAFHFAFDEMTAAGDVFYLERPPFMSNAQFAEYIRFMAKSFKGGAWRSFGKPDDLQVWSNHPAAANVMVTLKFNSKTQTLPAVDQIINLNNVIWFTGR